MKRPDCSSYEPEPIKIPQATEEHFSSDEEDINYKPAPPNPLPKAEEKHEEYNIMAYAKSK